MDAIRLHLRRRHGGEPVGVTHPSRVALPELVLALLVVAVGLGAGIRWPWVVAVACSLAAVGSFQAARAAIDLERRRRSADEWLLWGATARPSAALLSWRASELSSPRLRATLARSLRRIEREARGVTLPGPVPLNTRAIRLHLHLVHALADRLDEPDCPASVRGVLLVDRLLTEPGSPLYSFVDEDVVAQSLSEARSELDAASPAVAA